MDIYDLKKYLLYLRFAPGLATNFHEQKLLIYDKW